MKTNKHYFRSAVFHCLDDKNYQYFADGLLVVADGKVAAVGDYQTLKNQVPSNSVIEHYANGLLMPGFIDVHLHYVQYKIIASYGKTLLNWLNQYTFAEEQKFADSRYGEKIAKLFFAELLRNGTTTAMSFASSHKQSVDAFFQVASDLNLRMAAGKVMMDRNAPAALCDDAKSSYEDSQALIEKWHNHKRLTYALTPRFAPTSTPEQLAFAGQLLKAYQGDDKTRPIHMQTHLNENVDEISWVKALFPKHKNYLDVYHHYGLLGPNSVFGHCIHNTASELEQLAATQSKVALCPRSNLFLGSGLFDLASLEARGIGCALASDIGGGDSFSMFAVMREAYKVCQLKQQDLSAFKAFYLATLAGAKTLNLADCLGNFAVNKEADFLLIDLEATPLIKEKIQHCDGDIEQILFALMMLGDDRLIDKVFILGQCLYNKSLNREKTND